MKLLLVGGTGLVGSEVLKLALAEPRIETLVVPTPRGRAPRAGAWRLAAGRGHRQGREQPLAVFLFSGQG